MKNIFTFIKKYIDSLRSEEVAIERESEILLHYILSNNDIDKSIKIFANLEEKFALEMQRRQDEAQKVYNLISLTRYENYKNKVQIEI